jgi:hypothetical protein
MHVKLQNKHEGGPISRAPLPTHAICCTSGNVKVPAEASSRYTQCGVLSTGVHGTQWPSSSSANTHPQAVVRNTGPNSWLLYALQQRRQDHVLCHKVAGNFMACELGSIWKETALTKLNYRGADKSLIRPTSRCTYFV